MRRILSFALFVVIALPAFAGMNRWTETGPPGGGVWDLRFDPSNPSIVYAATQGGLFKSWNGGTDWYWASRGMGGPSAVGIAFDNASPRGLYVTGDTGAYKTTDGITWTTISNSIGNVIAVDPTNPSTIYIAGIGPPRKTIDGGANWTPANTGIASGSVKDLAIDPRNPWTLYLTSTSGVYKSTNYADSWTKLSPTDSVFQIDIDPNDSTVYVSVLGGILRSRDGGATWRKFDDASGIPPGMIPNAIAHDPSHPTTLYLAGYEHLLVSTDAGLSWNPVTTMSFGRDDVNAIAVHPQNGSVYVGLFFGGVMRYGGGVFWTPLTKGMTGGRTVHVAVDPNDPDTVYATDRFSLYKTGNAGATWNNLDVASAEYVVIDRNDSRKVYVAAYRTFYGSTDGGEHFTKYQDVFPADVKHLVISDDGVLFAALHNKGVYRSTTGGSAWLPSNSGIASEELRHLAITGGASPVLYATSEHGLYRSNGGLSWTPVSAFPCEEATTVAPDRTNLQRLFVTGSCGVFRSMDGGATFTDIGAALGGRAGRIVLGEPPQGVWALTSRGTGGLDHTDGEKYARIYFSADNGATWSRQRAGVRFSNISSAATSANGKMIHIATTGGGIVSFTRSSVYLPVVASLHGIGSFFHSDAMVLNTSSTETQQILVQYMTLAGVLTSKTITLAPREARTYDDIVVSLFGRAETGGTVAFTAPEHIVVTSRLYTPSKPAPTTGQFIPGVTDDEAYGSAAMPSLSFKVSGAGGFRTNAGVFNIAPAQDVTFSLYNENGGLLGRRTEHLNQWRGVQINNIFGAAGVTHDVTNAYCVITSSRDAGLFGYASVLDNQSQDPIFVRGCNAHEGVAGTTVIPAAASLHGINAFFHSDVSVLNVAETGAAAHVTATFRPFSGAPVTRAFNVPPRTTSVFDDMVGTFFGAPESGGAIEFVTDGKIAVTSRLYTPSKPAPTFGQFVHGMSTMAAYPRAVLTSLSHATSGGFRSNVGAYNESDVAQAIVFELYAANGTKLGQTTRNVGARQPVQVNNIFGAVGVTQNVSAAYCVVSSTAGTPLFAYASVIDNQSQDPIFVYGDCDPDW